MRHSPCPLCGLPLRYGQQRHGPAYLHGEAVHMECLDQQPDEPTPSHGGRHGG